MFLIGESQTLHESNALKTMYDDFVSDVCNQYAA